MSSKQCKCLMRARAWRGSDFSICKLIALTAHAEAADVSPDSCGIASRRVCFLPMHVK